MANRTLRRDKSKIAGNDGTVSTADGVEQTDTGNSIAGVSDSDSSVDGNGNERESDASSIGSVRIVEVDPEQLGEYIANGTGESDSSGDGTRKRRKRGPNKRTTGAKKAQETIAPFLLMAHNWASVFLRTPELCLSQDEAQKLSDSYSTFCEYHDVPVLSAKRLSEINLIASLALVYFPRIVAVRNRIKEEKINRTRNVTEFPSSHQSTVTQ
jgi:hypothetical protein